jgi:hypothetical protein
MSDIIKIVLLTLFIVLLIIVGPLLTIWALNTLFPVLAISYGFYEWLSIILLGMFFRANVTNIKK